MTILVEQRQNRSDSSQKRSPWKFLFDATNFIPRDYSVYNIFGLHDCSMNIGPKMGIPEDLSYYAEGHYLQEYDGYYGHTWFTFDELRNHNWDYIITEEDPTPQNYIGTTLRELVGREFWDLYSVLETLEERGREIRVLIWFDS